MSKGNSSTKACSFPLTNQIKRDPSVHLKPTLKICSKAEPDHQTKELLLIKANSQPSEETTKEEEIFENEIWEGINIQNTWGI